MKRIFFLIAVVSSIFLFSITNAQDKAVMTFSLKEAQDFAYANNYDLKNSAFDVEIAKKLVKQNTAIGLPQINGGIDYIDFLAIPTTLIPGEFLGQTDPIAVQFGSEYNATLKGTLNQLLYSGQYLVGLQTAKAYLESVRQQNVKDKMDVRDVVANSYLTVLMFKEQKKILDSVHNVLSKGVEEARASFKLGLIEDDDVSQLELNKSDLEATMINTSSNLEISIARLKFTMGLKDSQQITLKDSLVVFINTLARDYLMTQPFDYSANVDYTLLQKRTYVTLMQFKLAKTAYQPTLSGFLSASGNAQRSMWTFFNDHFPWYGTASWGLSLSIPIWSSGYRKNNVGQAKLNYEKMKVNEDKMRTGLELQVATAKNDFNNAYLIYLNKNKGLDISTNIYTKMIRKYKEGVSGSTDLNQKYNQFLSSQRDYLMSMYDVLNKKIQLARLLEKTF